MVEPRVFVGTMYCGEGDYSKCLEAIAAQDGVVIKHISISDLPEKDAHNKLWQSWRDVKQDFDMFVKIDADTVLTHRTVLLEFWKMMQKNPRITGIQAPLLDYFTDGHINGLNCFSPKVTFRDSADELFCDRQVDIDHDIVIKSEGVPPPLRPAGFHCYHSSPVQAFHFGLHRALKNQTQVIELVHQAWKRYNDRLRALAFIGATYAPVFNVGGFNYKDERFQNVFEAVTHNFDQIVKTL
jgi:hypothetical protein